MHFLVLLLPLLHAGLASNILVLSPITAPSHSNFFKPIVKELTRRGHSVTYWNGLKADKETGRTKNLRHLYSDEIGVINSDHQVGFKDRDKPFELFLAFYDRTIKYCTAIYQDPIFHQLMTSDEQFDIILIEGVLNECVLPIVHAKKAPFIYLNSIAPTPWLLDAVGSPQAYDHFPNPAFSFTDEMTIWQRMMNAASGVFIIYFRNYVLMPTVDRIASKMLGGSNYSSVIDTENRHLSLIITNTHFSINYQLPKSSAIIEAGGLHCRSSKPLSSDLEEFVSGSDDAGFIIVSFGSILRGANMPVEIRRLFLSTFSRLRQRVIWKWEEDGGTTNTTELEVPPNVRLLSWLPQQDLLGHPKARLFITHAGLFSKQEAVYHGVPLIALPVFADQPINARKIHNDGYGIHLDWNTLTEEILHDAIQQILTQPRYKERMLQVSRLMRDQIDHPLERAIYWIEYVIRHKGAHHLRTASRQLSIFQRGLMDVAFLSFIVMILIGSALAYLIYSCLSAKAKNFEGGRDKKNN